MSTRTEQYLTQQEAAEVAQVSLDTIKRARKKGRLPGARQRTDVHGTWELPYSDLVTAGLVDAGAHSAHDIDEQLGLSRTTRRVAELAAEVEVARTDAAHYREQVDQLTRLVGAAQKDKEQLYRLLLNMQEVR